MTRHRKLLVTITLAGTLVVAVVAGMGVGLSGCFSPKEVPCAFTCLDPSHACPQDFTCGDDGLCHREGAVGECPLAPPGDAGTDAEAGGSDAGAD
jgi:hypothetical protein